MKNIWCWRCRKMVPMLDEHEYAEVESTLKKYQALFPSVRDDQKEYNRMLREMEDKLEDIHRRIIGKRPKDTDTVIHHRASIYGPPCPSCGKELRTPAASRCFECGWKKEQDPSTQPSSSNAIYTASDVERWQQVLRESLPKALADCRSGQPGPWGDYGLSRLSLQYKDVAFTAAAQGQWSKAMGYFAASCSVMAVLYEQFASGKNIDPEYLSMANWTFLLQAHAANSPSVAARFAQVFDLKYASDKRTMSTEGAIYLGTALRYLSEGQVDAARAALGKKPPKGSTLDLAIIACLAAIARLDEAAFASDLARAALAWQNHAREHWRGQPASVCFDGGVGLVRLAERVWKKAVLPNIAGIPDEMLGDCRPEPIATGL
ncbi:MAG: hypothetical protein ABFD92_12635 [Planctomycetaceae bacterium]|nr:hypothetical protein [Planctomycetaceae bacterium]